MVAQRKPQPTETESNLIISSRVKGTPVFNAEGERIGHVEDLSIERVSGIVRYALMSFGGFLGIGDRLHPLPWAILSFDTEQQGYVVPLSKEALQGAPHYTPDELTAYGGQDLQYRGELFKYYGRYGVDPYWGV